MPRKPRIDLPGFHHVINRGVNRENIFLCNDDKSKFLDILEITRDVYHLTIHSFCILDNHYHLLIKTRQKNLSLAIRFINSQYAIYFNKKMDRVGPLWQGRFKSWYVQNDVYLYLLIRYVEMNPVKAGLANKISEYPFSSSYFVGHSLRSELLTDSMLYQKDFHNWLAPLSEKEIAEMADFEKVKYEKEGEILVQKQQLPLSGYFSPGLVRGRRNYLIYKAFLDGYLQSDIARYLHLSCAAISRIIGFEREKREIFSNIRDKGLFWSYGPDIEYDDKISSLLIETALKYTGIDEIKIIIAIFGIREVRKVWEDYLRNDSRFKRLNYFLARIFFNLDVEVSDFVEIKETRGDKLRLLAG